GNTMATYRLANGLLDTAHNDSAITGWLIGEMGLPGLARMWQRYHGTDPALTIPLIASLEATNHDTLALNNYTVNALLGYDNTLANTLLTAYSYQPAHYGAIMDSLLARHRAQVVAALTPGPLRSALLAQVMQLAANDFLDCFDQAALSAMHQALYGGTPPPPANKPDIINDLIDNSVRQQLIDHLTMLYQVQTSDYLSNCLSSAQLLDALKDGTYLNYYDALLAVSGELGTSNLAGFFATGGDPDPLRPHRLLNAHGTHAYMLEQARTHDPDSFLIKSLAINRLVLDHLLPRLDWFSATAYLHMVRRYLGYAKMQQLMDQLGLELVYHQQLQLTGHQLYGSSRLGQRADTLTLYATRFTASDMDTATGLITKNQVLYERTAATDTTRARRLLAHKQFELTNHLGNVLAVATDKRKYFKDTVVGTDTIIIWNAYLSTANDYYPFGMLIPSRIYADTALTREMVYNVTSYEKATHRQDFTHSVDGFVSTNGADTATVSGRMAITTNAVNESVQYDYATTPGKQYTFYILADPGPSDSFYLRVQRLSPQALIYDHLMTDGINEFTFTAQGNTTRLRPRRTDHTNQGAMTSYIDRIILKETRDTFYTDTVTLATGEGYKYGFNGMEQENDWNGPGNSYDFGARIYDARTGRWLARDKHECDYPFVGSYSFTLNNPIFYLDPDGNDVITHFVYYTDKGRVEFSIVESSDVEWKVNDQYQNTGFTPFNKERTIVLDVRSNIKPEDNKTTVGEYRLSAITLSDYTEQKAVAIDHFLTGDAELRFKGGIHFFTTDGSTGGQEMTIGELAEFVDATDLIAAVTGYKGMVDGAGIGFGPSKKDMKVAVVATSEILGRTLSAGSEVVHGLLEVGQKILDYQESLESPENNKTQYRTKGDGTTHIDTLNVDSTGQVIDKDTTNNQVSKEKFRSERAKDEK
ncbi:MAG: hypothetical protein HYZ16_04395, partial [Bacteroidetes bacterium]|nr:hypothetical protein [Bacteroidota bacterium]